MRAGRRGCGSERGFQSFWFVVPGVLQFAPRFVVYQHGERGWSFKLHSFGAMDPSRAQRLDDRVCAFHQFGFFCWARMPFSLGFSTCFAQGTVARQRLLRKGAVCLGHPVFARATFWFRFCLVCRLLSSHPYLRSYEQPYRSEEYGYPRSVLLLQRPRHRHSFVIS